MLSRLLFGQHEGHIPVILVVALPANQQRVRLRPGVLSALRTSKLCLTGFLRFAVVARRNGLPVELKPCRSQFCICLGVAAVRDNVMTHRLPGLLAARLAGSCWLQADLAHFPRPLPVVIPPACCLPVSLLPDMTHLMHKR